MQSCITCNSQILSIIIPTQAPFEIIWISSSKPHSTFQTVQLQELQEADEAVTETTLPMPSGAGCHGPTDHRCQPDQAPRRTSRRICAQDGMGTAGTRGQPVRLGHCYVFQQLQTLRCQVKSKVVPGTSKINCKVIHSAALQSSFALCFPCHSKGLEDYLGHCCSSADRPPRGRVVRDETAESPLLRALPLF